MKKKRKPKTCPKHGCQLVFDSYRTFGAKRTPLFKCPVEGCDIRSYVSQTSTPADRETMAARQRAHKHFDQIWAQQKRSRNEAYRALAEHLCIRKRYCHIGMFDKEQCEKTIAWAIEQGAEPIQKNELAASVFSDV